MNASGPAPVLTALAGYQTSGIINAAIQLGAFAPMVRGERTAAQIARAIRCPERSTTIMLDALTAIGFLTKSARLYGLTPLAERHLVPGAEGYVGDAARIFCAPQLWEAMGRFAEAVRHGGTVLPLHAETPGHRFWETVAENSATLASPSAEYLANVMQRYLEDRPSARVLDVGCGSGIYGLTLAKHHPGVRVALQDRTQVLEAARRNAEALGVLDRVKFVAGDMFTTELGTGYDVVVASQIFHHFGPGSCEKLIRRLGKAAAPGGRIIVHDFVADEDRKANPPAALFAAVMLAWTREGSTYTFSEFTRLFAKGGFLAPVLHTPPHLNTQFLVGERKSRRARRG